jgi:hypothetical protein
MWQDYLSKSARNLAAAVRDLEAGSYDSCECNFARIVAVIFALYVA